MLVLLQTPQSRHSALLRSYWVVGLPLTCREGSLSLTLNMAPFQSLLPPRDTSVVWVPTSYKWGAAVAFLRSHSHVP